MMTRESRDYETIADHLQAISLHMEAAAGHLAALEKAHIPLLVYYKIRVDADKLFFLAQLAEQRAQAALSGETIHAPE